ncbi:hypothetical protein ACFFX0_31825 [Citricoccus parietis]|uniref:Uncharacterized protein n=1 Tax=Citricoccus parietis TaxID=592307 RepID=A0ABV5G991_9MICC
MRPGPERGRNPPYLPPSRGGHINSSRSRPVLGPNRALACRGRFHRSGANGSSRAGLIPDQRSDASTAEGNAAMAVTGCDAVDVEIGPNQELRV